MIDEKIVQYITPIGIGAPWVATEVHAMIEGGISCRLSALRKPTATWFSADWANTLHEQTESIYPLGSRVVFSVLSAPFRFRTRFVSALTNALFGKRESVTKRAAALAHLFVACHWARGLDPNEVGLIHAQWIHASATVGMYAAWLTGIPFSFTGHAVDLFRDRVALNDKIRRARFIVCISNFHRQFYLDHGADDSQLITVHCGIETEMYEFRLRESLPEVPHVISIGRLIEKKGFEYLIDACGMLRDRGVSIRCTIAGDGPLMGPLRQRVQDLNLDAVVEITGKAVLQEQMAEFMHSGDLFAQPCVWSSDNDVDGTPRTLMEAMACGVPSVSTRLAGIPDIIEEGVSGLLVEPNSVTDLADALERLINEPGLVGTLSRGGRAHIEREFQLPDCLAALESKFRSLLQQSESELPIATQPPAKTPHTAGVQ